MRRARRRRRFEMNTMRKRVAQLLAGVVGLASVATAGVALAANGSPSPTPGKAPTAVSTDDRRGHDGRGEKNEAGDDHGRHHEGEGEDHHGDNRGPGDDQGEHGDNSGPGGGND